MSTPETLLKLSASGDVAADVTTGMAQWSPWLVPISDTQPAGEDPAYDDDFQSMREEINKLSGMDPERLCSLGERVLCSRAKDVRVVTWLTLGMILRDGEKGLAQGILLLAALVKQYGSTVHPRRPAARKAALEWLNSDRLLDALQRWPEVVPGDANLTAGALAALAEMTREWPDEAQPAFDGLCAALQQRLQLSGGQDSLVPQNSRDSGAEPEISSPAAVQLSPVASGRDLLDQARLLSKWLSGQPAGWLAAHRLMKVIRWDTVDVLPPMDGAGRTRLTPPRADYRSHLKRLHRQKSWIELVEYASQAFCEGRNHFCLDLQWYLWQGLSHAGPPWESYAATVTADLTLFLHRLTGLETLAWSDGTPYADEVTLAWIGEEVRRQAWQPEAEPVVVVSTGAGDVLALEAEAIEKGDAEGPDAAISWLQSQAVILSSRNRWLLRLVMARVAEQYGRHDMALHLLGELSESTPLTLTDWEPGLMFDVLARRVRLLRLKSGRSESERARTAPEMDALIARLIHIDPARAMVLCS